MAFTEGRANPAGTQATEFKALKRGTEAQTSKPKEGPRETELGLFKNTGLGLLERLTAQSNALRNVRR